jgi:hypothetical protein
MKTVLMTFAMLVGMTAFGQTKDAGVNFIALEMLLQSAPNMSIDGDIHRHETVSSILDEAYRMNLKMENECSLKTSERQYECTLYITHTYKGYYAGETAIIYSIATDSSGQMLNVLPMRAYIARGH